MIDAKEVAKRVLERLWPDIHTNEFGVGPLERALAGHLEAEIARAQGPLKLKTRGQEVARDLFSTMMHTPNGASLIIGAEGTTNRVHAKYRFEDEAERDCITARALIANAIDAEIAAERERCAKVAECTAGVFGGNHSYSASGALQVAENIRARNPAP